MSSDKTSLQGVIPKYCKLVSSEMVEVNENLCDAVPARNLLNARRLRTSAMFCIAFPPNSLEELEDMTISIFEAVWISTFLPAKIFRSGEGEGVAASPTPEDTLVLSFNSTATLMFGHEQLLLPVVVAFHGDEQLTTG